MKRMVRVLRSTNGYMQGMRLHRIGAGSHHSNMGKSVTHSSVVALSSSSPRARATNWRTRSKALRREPGLRLSPRKTMTASRDSPAQHSTQPAGRTSEDHQMMIWYSAQG